MRSPIEGIGLGRIRGTTAVPDRSTVAREARKVLIRKRIKRVGFYLLLAVIAVYLVFPFYWAVMSSFKTDSQLAMSPATYLPRDPETGAISFFTGNYEMVLASERVRRAMINSIIVATAVTLLALSVGSFAAFALGKLRFRGKTASLYVILSMTMFPQIAILTGLYVIIRSLELEPRPSMVLTYLLFSLPLTVWVLTSYFRSIPDDLVQAAQADGATAFQTFRLVLLPLAVPALATTGILAFIASWNEYLFALTFTTIKPLDRTVPVTIAFFQGNGFFGLLMAASVVVTVPLVVLVLIFQRRIIGGLTRAVKG